MEHSAHKSRALIILGMHRSGTSALTGLLHHMGIPIGKSILNAVPGDNEKGYWENQDIVEINEEILSDTNSAWNELYKFNFDNFPNVDLYKSKIQSIINNNFSNNKLWMVKDPRICRLLPIWEKVLQNLNCKPLYCIIFRNPFEVAASLKKRGNMDLHQSLLLWLQHNLDAERYTRDKNRIFINYETFLSDWETTLDKVKNTFNIKFEISPSDIKNIGLGFIDPKLNHHNENNIPNVRHKLLSSWIKDCYSLFNDLQNYASNDIYTKLDSIDNEISLIYDLISPILNEKISSLNKIEKEFLTSASIIKEHETNIVKIKHVIKEVESANQNTTNILIKCETQVKNLRNVNTRLKIYMAIIILMIFLYAAYHIINIFFT